MKLNRFNSKQLLDNQDAVYRKKLIDSVESDVITDDALDGFLHSDITWSDVQRMDKRYEKSKQLWTKSKWLLRGLSILALVLVAGSYFVTNYNYEKVNTENKIATENKVIKDKRSAPISLINEANSNALNSGVQTVPTNIFVQSLIQNSIPSSDAVSIENSPLFIDSSSGPMKTLQTKILSSSKKLKNEGQVGREVLIQTLKTVDYRVYRKENTVIVDGNSLLNGVSANQSNQSSSTENLERKEIAYFDFLTETMRFFNKGMIDLATENFDLILETFPDDVNALFYSGLCALENKDFRKSISFFESVRIHNFTNFREEAEWKLMNVYMLEKELSKAKSLRDEIIQKNGFYAKQAKSIEL